MKLGSKENAIEHFNKYLSLAPDAKDVGYIKQYLQQLKGQK